MQDEVRRWRVHFKNAIFIKIYAEDRRLLDEVARLTKTRMNVHVQAAIDMFLAAPRPVGNKPRSLQGMMITLPEVTLSKVRSYSRSVGEDDSEVIGAAIHDYLLVNKEAIENKETRLSKYLQPYGR